MNDPKKQAEIVDKVLKEIEFREGGDYFAFSTANFREAEVQDITLHEFISLIGEVVAITHDAVYTEGVKDGK